MWVIPKNFQPCSVFVRDTVESKEDLNLLEPVIESSLTLNSQHSPLLTWLRRWKRVSWLPLLFGRTLKPSQHISFEAALTSSLEVIRASRSQMQENEAAKRIHDISGDTSESMSEQLDLFNVSLKTSKVTSRLDSTASSVIWKKMVTTQRGEYLARMKSERLINEKEFFFYPTPTVQDSDKATKKMRTNHQNNLTAVVFSQALLPTPTARCLLYTSPSPRD